MLPKMRSLKLVGFMAVFCVVASPAGAMSEVEEVVGKLQQIVDDNSGTPLADKAEDALAKAQTALDELAKTPPDHQAAVGNMEGVVGDIQVAVDDDLFDDDQGTELMNLLSCAAWRLGAGAIYQAIDCQVDPGEIADAEAALAEGEQLWLAGAYKDSVNKYKDALAKAEGAVSCPIDPLAGLVTQDLENADGEDVGKALLCYDENANETCIRLKCWDLEAQMEYTALLGEYDDGEVTDWIELGSLTTRERGQGHLVARVEGDFSDYYVAVAVEVIDGGVRLLASDETLENMLNEVCNTEICLKPWQGPTR